MPSVSLTVRLPRRPGSVGAVRHLLDHTLTALQVSADCRYDLVLAVGEACANAVEHARTGAEFQVTIHADRQRCVVEVTDDGVGLVPAGNGAVSPPTLAARGRGLAIIRACTEDLSMDPVHPHGLTVRFSKSLTGDRSAEAAV